MIDAALRTSLSAFDDAALATLANPGLVRRAHRDLEEGKLRLISAGDGRAAVEADGQLVALDTRGPRAADCACKSVAVCRHRIAAVLFLQRLGDQAEAPAAAADPAEIAAALDPTALQRWAGKANWRAALELFEAAVTVEPTASAIAVTFPDLEGPVRILRGQGFDGIVSKATKTRAKAYHAAAALAARRHFGAAPPQTVDEEEGAVAAEVEIDRAFLDRVALSLNEVATLGFNLAPLPLEESLFELSVSSRADSLPRLSAILRGIAAQVRLRRQRALSFDPDRMLELAATAFALTRALAGGDPARRADLAGKVRRDFASAAPLSLFGCGGERWRTDAGARGVTAWFLERDTGVWLSTTLARGPGQDPDFRPADAWRAQSMWQAEPLAVLAHAAIHLEGARRSADDRLSAPASARATILARDVRPDPTWPGVVRDWRELRGVWLRQTGLGLSAIETPTACLVAPSAIAPPYFDDLTQQLVWPLRDAGGDWLAATLDNDETAAAAIEALESNVNSSWRGLVLVRLSRAGGALEVRPISLFGSGEPVDLTLWRRPRAPGRGSGSDLVQDWLARLRNTGGRRFARRDGEGADAALAAAWRSLLDRAEAGAVAARQDGHADRLDQRGMPTLAARMREIGAPAGVLAAAYGLMLARQQRCAAPLLR